MANQYPTKSAVFIVVILVLLMMTLCCEQKQQEEEQVTFVYNPKEGKVHSSDQYFINKGSFIHGGYCSALHSDFTVFGVLAFCSSDSRGLTIDLGYGFTKDGITSSKDALFRNIKLEIDPNLNFRPRLDLLTINPSKSSYLVVSAINSARDFPGIKFDYTFSTNDAKVNQYIAKRTLKENPILWIPLTELTGSSIDINVQINGTGWNLFGSADLTISNVNSNRRTSWQYSKQSYKCNNYNCMIETVVNETLVEDRLSIEYYSGSTLLNSYNNYQMAKLTPSLLSLSSDVDINLKTQFTTNEFFSSTIETNSFSLSNGYYLKNGDKVHSTSQPITILLESRNTNAFPMEAISSITWSLSVAVGVDLTLYSNKPHVTLPANIFQNLDQVRVTANLLINQVSIDLSTILYIQNIGEISLFTDPTIPFMTSGTEVKFVTFVNNVRPSQIISVSYEPASLTLFANDFTSPSSTSASEIISTFKADVPGKYNIKQLITLTSGVRLFNYISTEVKLRRGFIAGCKLSPNYGVAYEDLFGITCPMALDETKISSIIVEVYSAGEKLLTLFNTKNGNFATRLPFSTNNHITITITDTNGYSQSTMFPYTAHMDPNYPSTLQGRIEKINYYLKENKARNFQTANNYAILLHLLTNVIISGIDSSQMAEYSLPISSILDYTITELDILRKTIFHNTVYDRAVTLLVPLLREVVNLADRIGLFPTLLSTKKQLIVENAKFLLVNDKQGLLSVRDRGIITRILSTVTASDQVTFWEDISLTNILDFNVVFRNQMSKLDSMFGQGLDMSAFGFRKQTHRFSTLSEMVSIERSFSGLKVQLPSTVLTDNGYPTNHYSLSMASFDISTQIASKNFDLGIGNHSRFCGNRLFSIEIDRSDGSTMRISELVTPIILTMDLLLDSSLASSIEKVNLTCRYLDETTNTWSTNGLTTEVVSSTSSSAIVRCNTIHLSTFTVFADYPSANSVNTYASQSTLTKTGLTNGEIAAAIVVPVVVVLIIIAVILIIVIFILVKMKRKSNSIDVEADKKKKQVDRVYKADSVQYDELKIEMSSNMFISDYKSLNSNTVPTTTSNLSIESSPITPNNSNFINKKYEILEKIGAGGFGAVFRAKNLFYSHSSKTANDLEYYAIKKIQLSGLSELNDKFKEAVNMFKIRHENLVSLEDAVIDESTNSLYLVMKFYGNGDLDLFVKTKRLLSERILKQIIVQVCRGLKYLEEERGLIHRDIKPSNIFVEYFNPNTELIKVVVSDFGLAKESNMMNSVSFAGTPFFMSPQALIGSKYSFNSDIFSLGCSIYLMITHDMSTSIAQLYFQKQGNVKQVEDYVRNQISNSCLNSSVSYSEEFLKIILQLLEFDGDSRPNATKVLELLDNTVDVLTV